MTLHALNSQKNPPQSQLLPLPSYFVHHLYISPIFKIIFSCLLPVADNPKTKSYFENDNVILKTGLVGQVAGKIRHDILREWTVTLRGFGNTLIS